MADEHDEDAEVASLSAYDSGSVLMLAGYAVGLASLDVSPEAVRADCPEFFDLASDFARLHASAELRAALDSAPLFSRPRGRRKEVTPTDRWCLASLAQAMTDYVGSQAPTQSTPEETAND